ncbi:2-oxoglutarate dehydrogenase complex dihydrolipoyllysine-residue succinyltransferase [Nannocystis bainbridge]|uniref:Dihydrolipoyllysine-residue succinyltransferase component of 2-oxoglutarate dehydrogenase complex n=1 Tax=Nannocystis bainbridge TaxID=2995303 RepID=A0ABT5E3W2_9BACT|nr:2-oxoglutarate dehydrogenase complex dihydrolipoyllysine-residue succinyltransferase [Nannocystis bainbridge]MDC0720547.1 2-oxoglutarate dehydrogenase complex dihydrolipoyllysine-residue succinyltransferase [Nannocystis bainbridge]
MPSPIKVPPLGESITEAIVSSWRVKAGDRVTVDQPLVELETDKITVEVPSPAAGVITELSAQQGAKVNVGDTIGVIGDAGAEPAPSDKSQTPGASGQDSSDRSQQSAKAEAKAETKPAAQAKAGGEPMPAARAEAGRTGVELEGVEGTGRGGRVLKEDVQRAAQAKDTKQPAPAAEAKPAASKPAAEAKPAAPSAPRPQASGREEIVAMTPLRRRVAERLVQAQQTAAILTTFNEVDMSAVYRLRNSYKQGFVDKHGAKLGFMSFFVKAAVSALKTYPAVNAEVRGEDIVYKRYYDVGVAVGGGKGLVVPVVRGADQLGFADIEKEIARLAVRARENKLTLDELSGGTFTISNGGIYGSMLSTPILNPPQTGILGLHNVVERPVAVNGQVEIRPIMYLALSYDHRLVDGREAVQFLVHVKERIEAPERLLLDV